MVPIFQPSPTEQTKTLKARLEDSFAMLLQGCSEGDFTRLINAIEDMKLREPRLHNSLRAQHLTRSIFDLVHAEDVYRRSRPMRERI